MQLNEKKRNNAEFSKLPRNRIGTPQQRKAVEYMVQNGGKLMPAMRKAGYSETTIDHAAGRVFRGKAFQQLLKEAGLTDMLITKSLVEDIEAKPQKRLGELTLGAQILGMINRGDDKEQGGDTHYHFHDEKYLTIISNAEKQLEEEMRKHVDTDS